MFPQPFSLSAEAAGRDEGSHFIIRHFVFLQQNLQHLLPFIRTDSGLCVGTVQHSAAWMEVSMWLIVSLLLLDAYGPTMIEILLTACGGLPVCGMLSFSRTDYSAACRQNERGDLCFQAGGPWRLWVFFCRRVYRRSVCVCVFLWKSHRKQNHVEPQPW